MIITTSKENLTSAINAVQRAINPKSIIPLYSYIKLSVKDDIAVFTGAGLDINIECSVPVQTSREGEALIPAKYFSDIVRRLPDIPITLEHSETMDLTIRYEKSVFTLKTLPVDDFPLPPAFSGGMEFSVTADTIKKLIRQSSFAASTDDLKAVFTGILWEIEGEVLSLIGTDTHRLAWSKGAIIAEKKDMKGSFILPAKTTIEIMRLMQNDVCVVKAEKNTIYFAFDNIKISCRVLNGSFPNYRQVIPSSFVTTISVNGAATRDVTERIALFATTNELTSTINMEISDNTLTIHSRSDFGFGREELGVTQEGDDMRISFNSRYISDVFKAIDGENIKMRLSGSLSAGIINDEEDADFMYLVLPVKA